MKKIALTILLIMLLLCNDRTLFAQITGTNAFIQGRYLEVGMTSYAAFGATLAPSGYHPFPFGSALGEVYDLGHDGWTVGVPPYMGDYTYPGSPYEGWGIQAGGASGLNWAFLSNGAISGPGSLTGHNVSYSNTGGKATVTWAGTTAGGQLNVNMQTSIDTNASWVVVRVALNNTGTTSLPGVYYFRGCDPDNDAGHGGGFNSKNGVSYQNDSFHRVLVSSSGIMDTSAYMGLGTKDSRAKAFVDVHWPIDYYTTDLSNVYAGTSPSGSLYTVGTVYSGDEGIGLIFNLGTIAAGDSAVFSYAYTFNGVSGIDSAFPTYCTGTPVAGAITSNSLLACTTTTVTLTDTGSTAFVSFQWQWSPDSASWTDISGANSYVCTINGIGSTTYYRTIATCVAGGSSDATAGFKITYTPACPCVLAGSGVVTSNIPYACTVATVTLTDSGCTSSGVALQWQSSPDSTTWTNIPGATSNVYSFTGLTATTFYRLNVVCISGGSSVASAGIKVAYHATCVCTGSPNAGAATASTTSCSSCSLTLNLSGATVADSLKYQWQKSTDSISWTNIAGATTVPYTFTPYGTYFYRCIVRCVYSGGSDTSAGIEVLYNYHIVSHNISNTPDTMCNGSAFYIQVNGVSPLLFVKTWYGDGAIDSVALTSGSVTAAATVMHSYEWPGNYSLKQVVYCNDVPQDSITFSYEYYYCHTLPLKFYLDLNSNCAKEATEPYNSIPILIQVDSNGISVDTISVTSGLYYHAHGMPGTVYEFSIVSTTYAPSCSSAPVLRDTIVATVNTYPIKYYGITCSASAFDLAVYDVVPVTGRHDQCGTVYARNNLCAPTNAAVTLYYSKLYDGGIWSASPVPAATTDSTITWDLTGLSNISGLIHLNYVIVTDFTAGIYLTPGQVIPTYVSISPYPGDADTLNNKCQIWDTVKASCDPNEMSVVPSGCILSGSGATSLQYTINFMNVGNDTAFNIYIMDTLSDNLDPSSLQIMMASNTMNIATLNDGAHNIVKFDFPQINLQDSSDCPLCSGAVIYSINTKSGLPDGTTIFNHAGVFFDYNPVVMTNSVENTIGCHSITTSANGTKSGTGNVQVFPNPTTSELTIKSTQNAYAIFTITNSIGQQLMQQPITGTQTKVDVSMLPTGLYYITFRGEHGTEVRKFVKS